MKTLSAYSWRELRRRPARTLLTVMGIVLGVAAILSVQTTIEATRGAYRAMFETLGGRAALEVVAEGMGGFDAHLSGSLAGLAGVRAAAPVIQTASAILADSGLTPVTVLGVDPSRDAAARDYEMRSGRMLGGRGEALIEEGFAAGHGIPLGGDLRLITPTGIASLQIVGLLGPKGAAAVHGGAVVFTTLDSAQEAFALSGQINAVHLVLDESADPRAVEAAVAARLPVGLTVRPPAARSLIAGDSLLPAEQGLAVVSVVSLVAGAFVILSTFLINAAERARSLAILRALGATARQVTRLLLGEALALGALGALAGAGLGLAMAAALHAVMEQLLGIPLPSVAVSLTPLLTALAAGPAVALGAALIPARRAARRAPLEGLRDIRSRQAGLPRWTAWIGGVLFAAGGAFVAAVLAHEIPQAVVTPLLPVIMAALVTSIMLLLPLLVPLLLAGAGAVARPLLGTEGRLAVRHLRRQLARSALTVGVLAVAVIVSLGVGNTLMNSVRDVRRWCRDITTFDFIVRGAWPDTGTLDAPTIPESLAAEIGELEGVLRADPLSFVPVQAQGQPAILVALSIPDDYAMRFRPPGVNAEELVEALARGEVVIGTALALRTGLDAGDSITLATRQGPRPCRIAATFAEYTAGGIALYMDWGHAQDLFALQGAHGFDVVAEEGASTKAAASLAAFCERNGLMLESRAEFTRLVEDTLAGVVGSMWVLIALVFIVASLGVANTLTVNVLEQTRELGVLRAVALRRGQLRKLILAQALVMAAVGLVPGLPAGAGLSWLMTACSLPVTGQPLDFQLEPSLYLAVIPLVLLLAGTAAWLPARRAARLQITAALQYE